MLYEHITKDMTHKKFVKEVRTDLPTCRLAACCLLLAPCFLWLAICCSLLAACDLLLAPSNQLDSPAPPCANKLLPLPLSPSLSLGWLAWPRLGRAVEAKARLRGRRRRGQGALRLWLWLLLPLPLPLRLRLRLRERHQPLATFFIFAARL